MTPSWYGIETVVEIAHSRIWAKSVKTRSEKRNIYLVRKNKILVSGITNSHPFVWIVAL